MPEAEDYLGPEAKARVEIDKQLTAAGWVVQRHKKTVQLRRRRLVR